MSEKKDLESIIASHVATYQNSLIDLSVKVSNLQKKSEDLNYELKIATLNKERVEAALAALDSVLREKAQQNKQTLPETLPPSQLDSTPLKK